MRYAQDIIGRCNRLSALPYVGRKEDRCRILNVQNHLIFCLVDDTTLVVTIAAIFNAPRDLDVLLDYLRGHWKSNALNPVTISSSPSGRVTGGSARDKQPTRSQRRQAGPMRTRVSALP